MHITRNTGPHVRITRTPSAPSAPSAPILRAIERTAEFYRAQAADSQDQLTKARARGDDFARGMYRGRIAAFGLILADLADLDAEVRHA